MKQKRTCCSTGSFPMPFFPVLFLFLLIFAFFTLPAAAEEGKMSTDPKPAGAVFSSNGGVLPKGKYSVAVKYFNFSLKQYYSGTDEMDFAAPASGNKVYEKSAQKVHMRLRAGISRHFDVTLMVPLLDKELTWKTASGAETVKDNSGIGDIKIISRYRVMTQKNGPLNLAVGLGVQTPTGSTDETDDSGKTLPGFLQNGSGAWDPFFELGMHKIVGRHFVSSYFTYQLATEGDLGDFVFKRSDVFKYNAAYMFALSKMFDIGVEFNGLNKSKAEQNGIKIDNSGGHSIFLTPAVNVKFAKGMRLGLCAGFAVYHNMNGSQQTEDYQALAKLGWKF